MTPILAELAKKYGWTETETGGGCTALVNTAANSTIRGMITNDAAVPENDRDGCVLGLYEAEGDDAAFVTFECPTVLNAFGIFGQIVN